MRIEQELKTNLIPNVSNLLDIEVDGKIEIWAYDTLLRSGDSNLDKPLREQLYLDVAPLDTRFLCQLIIKSDSDKVVYHFEDNNETNEERRERYMKLPRIIETKVGDKIEYIDTRNGVISHKK